MSNDKGDTFAKSQEVVFCVIPANPGPARRTRLWQAGRGPGQAPESRNNKHFWTPASAGVTALVTFARPLSLKFIPEFIIGVKKNLNRRKREDEVGY